MKDHTVASQCQKEFCEDVVPEHTSGSELPQVTITAAAMQRAVLKNINGKRKEKKGGRVRFLVCLS